MSSNSISFLMFELWLQRIFVFPGCILSPTFSALRLKSHNIFWSCSFGDEKRSTSSANLMFVKQSRSLVITQAYAHSSFLLPARNVFFQCFLHSKLDRGSPCLVPFLISNMSLSSSVSTVAFCSLYNFSGGGCNHVRYHRIGGHSNLICV